MLKEKTLSLKGSEPQIPSEVILKKAYDFFQL